jgi:hypothetical protein
MVGRLVPADRLLQGRDRWGGLGAELTQGDDRAKSTMGVRTWLPSQRDQLADRSALNRCAHRLECPDAGLDGRRPAIRRLQVEVSKFPAPLFAPADVPPPVQAVAQGDFAVSARSGDAPQHV